MLMNLLICGTNRNFFRLLYLISQETGWIKIIMITRLCRKSLKINFNSNCLMSGSEIFMFWKILNFESQVLTTGVKKGAFCWQSGQASWWRMCFLCILSSLLCPELCPLSYVFCPLFCPLSCVFCSQFFPLSPLICPKCL